MRTIGATAAGAAALAILAGGCGGAGAAGPGAADGAATIVPSDALAFAAASTDLSSSDWHGLGPLALRQLQISADEVRALAHGEVDAALLPGKRTVAFVQPRDEASLEAFATRRHRKLRRFGDWTAVAADTATLDAVAAAKTHLADNTLYLDAMSRLPKDALLRAYANGGEAHGLLASIPGQFETRQIPAGAKFRLQKQKPGSPTQYGLGTQEFRWLAAAVTSTDAGLKLEAIAAPGALVAPSPPRFVIRPVVPYTPGLPDEIPSGALAVVDLRLPAGAFELLPSLPPALLRLFAATSFDLPNSLDSLLGGETALYVRPGTPTPEFTLVTQPADTATASTTLDRLVEAAPQDSPLAKLTLHRAIIGGQLVVSTTQTGIDAFRSGGPKLSADPSFLQAKQESGMPDETTGFVYATAKALPLLALAGVHVRADAPDVRTLLAFGAQQQSGSTFTTFLGVR